MLNLLLKFTKNSHKNIGYFFPGLLSEEKKRKIAQKVLIPRPRLQFGGFSYNIIIYSDIFQIFN